MKITLVLTGKTDESFAKDGFNLFEKRLQHYIQFGSIILPDLKNAKSLNPAQVKEKEAELQLKSITDKDFVVLLDEKGKEYRSLDFAAFIQQKMNTSVNNLVFIVGGPWGFSEKIYKRANAKMSLSKMTFSHQIVRLLFIEQLYRAFTIIRNEPYHNEG
jgi:23S rRNA (pseudouridine1915-N3)-methyltransferase